MSNVSFNIYHKDVALFTLKLKEQHRKHLPAAVRSTLNDAAFDVKQKTLGQSFRKEFKVKNRTFLRSHTWAEKADGWDIHTMQSQVGVVAYKNKKSSEAAAGLKMQEFGGGKKKISIYNREARMGKKKTGMVAHDYYLRYLRTKGIIHDNWTHRGTKRSRFVAAAYMANKLGLLMRVDKQLFTMQSFSLLGGGRVSMRITNVANMDEERHIKLRKRPFLLPASLSSQKRMNEFYIKNAEFQLKKAKK